MKRILWAGVMLAATTVVSANNGNDTITVERPQQVVIVNNDSLQTVEISGKKGDPNYRLRHTFTAGENAESKDIMGKTWNVESIFGNNKPANGWVFLPMPSVHIGYNCALNAPDGMDVHNLGSIEADLNFFGIGYRKGHNIFYADLRVGGKMFNLHGDRMFTKDNGRVTFIPWSATYDSRHSQVMIGSIGIPFNYRYTMNNGFGVTAGVVFNWNMEGRISNSYKVNDATSHINGEKMTETFEDINVNPFTMDFETQFDYDGLGLYVKYSPFNVLKSGSAPKFQTISVGIAVTLF